MGGLPAGYGRRALYFIDIEAGHGCDNLMMEPERAGAANEESGFIKRPVSTYLTGMAMLSIWLNI